MAVTVEQPGFLQDLDYSAEQTRRETFGFMLQRGAYVGSVLGGLVGALSGVPDLQVTYSGSGLTVDVAGGEVVVPGSSQETQSGYPMKVASGGSLTCATANPSNPRIDLIYAQVEDEQYSGSSNLGQVAIATGTPTTGATLANLTGAPSVSTSAIAVAYVLIPANATTISATDILNEYPMAYFGPGIFNGRVVSGSSTVDANSGDSIAVSSGSTPIVLPVPFKNARVQVINYGSGIPTVSQNGAEKIYGLGLGSGGGTSFSLGTYGAAATLICLDGANWFIVAGSSDSGWVEPTLSTWTQGSPPVKYRLEGDLVTFEGVFAGSPTSGTLFTLPTGFCPPIQRQFLTYNAGPGVGYVFVLTTGGVTVAFISGSAFEAATVDGVSFTVD